MFCAVLLLLAYGVPCAAQAVQIQSDPAWNMSRCVVRDTNGNIYAVILDIAGTNATIRVYKSSNGGVTWTDEDASGAPTGTSYGGASAAIDGNGIIHIAYLGSPGLRYITFSTVTNTFSGDTAVASFRKGGWDGATAIAVDSNNDTHIVYEDGLKARGNIYNTINYIDNVGAGSGWNKNVEIFGAPNRLNGMMEDILIDQNNVPEVAYLDWHNGYVEAAIGNADQATSFTSQIVASDSTGSNSLNIAMDSSHDTWIAYVAYISGSTYPALVEHKAKDPWSTWQAPIDDIGGPGDDPNSGIALAAGGTTLFIAYQSYTSATVVWQGYDGSAWSSAIDLGQNIAGSSRYAPVLGWSEWFDNEPVAHPDVIMTNNDIFNQNAPLGAYWDIINPAVITISNISPMSGAVGTSVTISGSGFGSSQGSSTVTFDGVAATPTSWSDTSIVASVPAGANTGPVVVTVGGTASNGVTFTVAPSVSGLSQALDQLGLP